MRNGRHAAVLAARAAELDQREERLADRRRAVTARERAVDRARGTVLAGIELAFTIIRDQEHAMNAMPGIETPEDPPGAGYQIGPAVLAAHPEWGYLLGVPQTPSEPPAAATGQQATAAPENTPAPATAPQTTPTETTQ